MLRSTPYLIVIGHVFYCAVLQYHLALQYVVFMWLSCNLGKVNLETTLVGQRLSPRQAGLCRVATWSAGADM